MDKIDEELLLPTTVTPAPARAFSEPVLAQWQGLVSQGESSQLLADFEHYLHHNQQSLTPEKTKEYTALMARIPLGKDSADYALLEAALYGALHEKYEYSSNKDREDILAITKSLFIAQRAERIAASTRRVHNLPEYADVSGLMLQPLNAGIKHVLEWPKKDHSHITERLVAAVQEEVLKDLQEAKKAANYVPFVKREVVGWVKPAWPLEMPEFIEIAEPDVKKATISPMKPTKSYGSYTLPEVQRILFAEQERSYAEANRHKTQIELPFAEPMPLPSTHVQPIAEESARIASLMAVIGKIERENNALRKLGLPEPEPFQPPKAHSPRPIGTDLTETPKGSVLGMRGYLNPCALESMGRSTVAVTAQRVKDTIKRRTSLPLPLVPTKHYPFGETDAHTLQVVCPGGDRAKFERPIQARLVTFSNGRRRMRQAQTALMQEHPPMISPELCLLEKDEAGKLRPLNDTDKKSGIKPVDATQLDPLVELLSKQRPEFIPPSVVPADVSGDVVYTPPPEESMKWTSLAKAAWPGGGNSGFVDTLLNPSIVNDGRSK